jgi:hypothetical protein
MAILNYLSMADFRKAIDRVCGAGLQGVFADSHPLKARFRSNYAAKIDLEVDLPAGSTRLRLQCPGTGGIFVGSRAVYRSEDSNADEVRHLCTVVCFLSLSTCSTCSEGVPIEMACPPQWRCNVEKIVKAFLPCATHLLKSATQCALSAVHCLLHI